MPDLSLWKTLRSVALQCSAQINVESVFYG